ncbi:dehydrodolichyl diphosphate synthase complex subunit DHDDS isoform X3 [Daphnia magna]|uniref:dehydrodolichyl diphosphate synthase complex subunit DHDDS isoform X3 n=1 Tax=Daphnia magna TaxID=35525 RepID=UPI001E1BC168|nr:dehydrodolichyl diphosphate synthase complex subunit DHDDS isoform X3 [Daphnia magna]
MSWIQESKLKWYETLAVNVLKCGSIPKHVAFIMDGNRRFANKSGVKKIEGHSKGFDKLTEVLHWCLLLGVNEVTVYAFSIENFRRSEEEVDQLMSLAREKFKRLLEEKDKLNEHGISIRVIGNIGLLPADLQKLVVESMESTKSNTEAVLNIAFSYTSREEMTHAVREVAWGVQEDLLKIDDITEDLIQKCLYTRHSLQPDLLIRTSGEKHSPLPKKLTCPGEGPEEFVRRETTANKRKHGQDREVSQQNGSERISYKKPDSDTSLDLSDPFIVSNLC